MDFTFSDEQNMLRETAQRYLAKEYGFEKRTAISRSGRG